MKAIHWLSKLVISALITSLICVVSTFWVVNTYVDMILEQYNLKSAVSATPDWSKFAAHAGKQLQGFRLFGGAAGGTAGANGQAANKSGMAGDGTLPAISIGEQSGAGSDGSEGGASETKPSQSTGKESSTQRKPPEDAVAVFGHGSGDKTAPGAGSGTGSSAGSGTGTEAGSAAQSGKSASGSGISPGGSSVPGSGTGSGSETDEKIVVSAEQFTKKKDQLSTENKNKIFNMLVTRVPQKEMQAITNMMEGGITASEMKEIEKLLKTYMKPDEYDQLLRMIQSE
ncbi:hypothetical protein [Paenibacillus piri]|uniref:Spore coat protein n=1 Tax=Paenibacillus piri TaxID=2547395 RepID=A0A4R5KJ97_9BACL|nr:hypothetical protein [Paenibacillus piri]TDF94380.1 hypothetical protein E1757_23470 [Paenibacillus piri]